MNLCGASASLNAGLGKRNLRKNGICKTGARKAAPTLPGPPRNIAELNVAKHPNKSNPVYVSRIQGTHVSVRKLYDVHHLPKCIFEWPTYRPVEFVLAFLSFSDLLSCSLVCHAWKNLSSDAIKHLCRQHLDKMQYITMVPEHCAPLNVVRSQLRKLPKGTLEEFHGCRNAGSEVYKVMKAAGALLGMTDLSIPSLQRAVRCPNLLAVVADFDEVTAPDFVFVAAQQSLTECRLTQERVESDVWRLLFAWVHAVLNARFGRLGCDREYLAQMVPLRTIMQAIALK